MRISAGWRDYRHSEIEDEAIGTRFENEWTEARLDFVNHRIQGFEGTLGLQWAQRDFAANARRQQNHGDLHEQDMDFDYLLHYWRVSAVWRSGPEKNIDEGALY